VAFRNRNLRHQFAVHRRGLHRVRNVARGVKNALRLLGLSI
jgi:hypothetical protein